MQAIGRVWMCTLARPRCLAGSESGRDIEHKACAVFEVDVIFEDQITLEPNAMCANVSLLVAFGHKVNHRLSSSQWFAAKATSRLNNDARNLFIEHLQALRKQ